MKEILNYLVKNTLKLRSINKVLKDEVISLMEQLRGADFKLQNSETTVNAISDFFNNNTLIKLEKLKERKNKKEIESAGVH
mmetsp:Transcript_13911/g.15574  ORF Transcript_13911/g.15574 Transcript_13911/m.15574 type:complete len:81 (-) Transcript_13911:44-286(-)